ncbi:MAG: hypothetical protein AAFN27_13445, partial [Pseudomonadota bacterium]
MPTLRATGRCFGTLIAILFTALLFMGLLFAGLLFTVHPARANDVTPVSLELVLLADATGSIDQK